MIKQRWITYIAGKRIGISVLRITETLGVIKDESNFLEMRCTLGPADAVCLLNLALGGT